MKPRLKSQNNDFATTHKLYFITHVQMQKNQHLTQELKAWWNMPQCLRYFDGLLNKSRLCCMNRLRKCRSHLCDNAIDIGITHTPYMQRSTYVDRILFTTEPSHVPNASSPFTVKYIQIWEWLKVDLIKKNSTTSTHGLSNIRKLPLNVVDEIQSFWNYVSHLKH